MSKTLEGITLIHDSWKVLKERERKSEMNLAWYLLFIPYLKRYFVNKCCHAWLNTECPGNYHIVSIPIRIHFSFYLIDFLLFLPSLPLSLHSSYLIHLNKLVWAEWRVSHSNRSWELLRSWLVSNRERHRQTNTHTHTDKELADMLEIRVCSQLLGRVGSAFSRGREADGTFYYRN